MAKTIVNLTEQDMCAHTELWKYERGYILISRAHEKGPFSHDSEYAAEESILVVYRWESGFKFLVGRGERGFLERSFACKGS